MKLPRFASFLFAALLALLAEKDACAQWKNISSGKMPVLMTHPGYTGNVVIYRNGSLWVGFGNNLWVTNDLGNTWIDHSSKSFGEIIFDLDFFDNNNGVLGCWFGIFLTNDGGTTWRQVDSTFGAFSAHFIKSNNEIVCSYKNGGFLTISHDGGMTWQDITPPPRLGRGIFHVQTTPMGDIYVSRNDTVPNTRLIMHSVDYGITWSTSSKVDFDCWSFGIDSCDRNLIAVLNEEVFQNDKQAEIFISTNAGVSWSSNNPTNNFNYYCGSLSIAPGGVIFAQTTLDGIIRSTDYGKSWTSIGGPNGLTPDSRLIAAVSADTIFAVDNNGNVWLTTNSGGSPINEIKPFSYSTSPQSLFASDTMYICDPQKTENFILNTAGCLPKIISQNIAGKNANDYGIIKQIVTPLPNLDSVILAFKPSDSGSRNATYEITFDNGTKISIPLQGYGIASHPLTLSTTDQATDTIGGSIYVPITINGLDHAEDVDLVLHFDKELRYHGSYSLGNMQFDMANEGWSGRSKLHIAQAKPNTILGYARFDVFNDSLTKSHVTFDSVTVLTAVAPCQYILPASITSIITPPSGCGIQTLSRFMHDSTMPQLSIIPNPTSGEVSISSTQNLGAVSIAVYDMLGIKQSLSSMILQKNNPAKIILPVANGVYNLRIRSAERSYDLRVVVNK